MLQYIFLIVYIGLYILLIINQERVVNKLKKIKSHLGNNALSSCIQINLNHQNILFYGKNYKSLVHL